MNLIKYLFSPIVFALGFFAPLIAQSLTLLDVSFYGIDNLIVGLVIAALFGVMAQTRGSWIWIRP